MAEKTIEIRLSEPLSRYGLDQDEIQRRVAEWIVLSLFTEDRISSGKAAQLLGISRVEFLALLRAQRIAYIDYTRAELEEELAAAESLQPAEPHPQ